MWDPYQDNKNTNYGKITRSESRVQPPDQIVQEDRLQSKIRYKPFNVSI